MLKIAELQIKVFILTLQLIYVDRLYVRYFHFSFFSINLLSFLDNYLNILSGLKCEFYIAYFITIVGSLNC